MNVTTWEPIERPTGPQPIPHWCKGVHIDWRTQCNSWPDVKIKSFVDVGDWPNKRWKKSGKVYSTNHSDGRCAVHYHDGPLSVQTIRQYVDKHWVDRQMLATTKQDGYAGRDFIITMEDGQDVALRGPWHGSPLPGTVAIIVTNLSQYRPRRGMPWHNALGMFGVEVTEDLYIRMLSRFQPHVELARVTYDWGMTQIEPINPLEGVPHKVFCDQRRAATAKNVVTA